jgi:transposase InsO family protein
MTAKGCCWVNAVVESFFSTLKLELNLDHNRRALISPQQMQRDVPSGLRAITTAKGDTPRSVTSARSTTSSRSLLSVHFPL